MKKALLTLFLSSVCSIAFAQKSVVIIDYFTNYNLCSFDPVESINPHTDYINSVVLLKDGRIASCSDDSTIKIFNPLKNYKCEITLKGHNEGVNSICIIDSGQLVSCSRDGIYKIWTK